MNMYFFPEKCRIFSVLNIQTQKLFKTLLLTALHYNVMYTIFYFAYLSAKHVTISIRIKEYVVKTEKDIKFTLSFLQNEIILLSISTKTFCPCKNQL